MSDSCEMCDAFRSHREAMGLAPDTFDKCYFIESCHGATEEEKEIHTQKWKMVSVCGLLHEDGRMQSNFDFINPMDRDCIPSAKSEARHEALAGLLTGDRSRS